MCTVYIKACIAWLREALCICGWDSVTSSHALPLLIHYSAYIPGYHQTRHVAFLMPTSRFLETLLALCTEFAVLLPYYGWWKWRRLCIVTSKSFFNAAQFLRSNIHITLYSLQWRVLFSIHDHVVWCGKFLMEARHPIQFTLRALHTYIKSYTLADMMRQMSTLSTFFWHIRRLYIDYIVTFLLRNTYLSIHIKHAGAWLPTLINDVNLEQFTHQVIHCASLDTQGLPDWFDSEFHPGPRITLIKRCSLIHWAFKATKSTVFSPTFIVMFTTIAKCLPYFCSIIHGKYLRSKVLVQLFWSNMCQNHHIITISFKLHCLLDNHQHWCIEFQSV